MQVWDRRILSKDGTKSKPVGILAGHTLGITHLDSRNDGIHAISNSKDQSIRLWDLRKTLPPSEVFL